MENAGAGLAAIERGVLDDGLSGAVTVETDDAYALRFTHAVVNSGSFAGITLCFDLCHYFVHGFRFRLSLAIFGSFFHEDEANEDDHPMSDNIRSRKNLSDAAHFSWALTVTSCCIAVANIL